MDEYACSSKKAKNSPLALSDISKDVSMTVIIIVAGSL